MTDAPRNSSGTGEPSRLPPIVVTMGDPAGIGPDITLMSWHQRVRHGLPAFAVYADPDLLASRKRALDLDVPLAILGSPGEAASRFARALPVVPVDIGRDAAAAVVGSIERAVAAVTGGEALALLTNPITKRALDLAELPYPGHTEFLAELAVRLCGEPRPRPVMMLAAEELKVVPATVHIPFTAVAGALTRPLLTQTIRITAAALAGDFGIAAPRIAVAGLNPHAGEGGLIGREETELIGPVVRELAAEGLAVTGPYSADTLFHAEARATYDAVVAMYHDQALIPIKTLAFDRGVNVTLGLPFVRTSPDHGTAFALAGTGRARPGSFIAALRLAAELGQRRAEASDRRGP
jgi:4-hydroxythreonine-4-phosphate dehydrogenase